MAKDDSDYRDYIRARKTPPPPLLHKYTSAETARHILSTGRTRFQSPLRYNDPFDSQWDPTWNLRTPKAAKFNKRLMTSAIEDPESWPEEIDPQFETALLNERNRIYALPLANRKSAILEFVEHACDCRELHEAMRAVMLDFRRRLRVLCLSANPKSITMWSHYGDQHRGVLLTFDTAMLEDGLKRPVTKVLYENSPPALMDMEMWYRATTFGLPEPKLPEDPSIWTRTKSPEWKQEQEWRLTTLAPKSTLGDYQDFDVPKRSLVEMTMGCRTDREVTRELVALAQPFGVQVKYSQLFMAVGTFSLAKRNLSFSDLL